MSPLRAAEFERLCQDAAWVRRLAIGLVGNEHDAEDIAQDAWVSALSAAPPERASFRHWMAAVVRNASRSRHRSGERRQRRELAVASQDHDSERGTLESLETHQMLVEAVRKLDEPYRSIIVKRYFEQLTPRAIAAQSGVPVRTIHTQLHRGLAQLRGKLTGPLGTPESGNGHRRALLGLLAPVLPYAKPLAIGAAAMTKKGTITVVACSLLALGGGVAWMLSGSAEAEPPDSTVPAPAVAALPASEAVPNSEPSRTEVANTVAPAAEITQLVATDSAAGLAKGIVLSTDGTVVSRVLVRCTNFGGNVSLAEYTSDANGAFDLARGASGGVLQVVDPHWVTVLQPHLYDTEDHPELTIVVAPAVEIAGRVVDQNGGGVPKVRVRFGWSRELRASTRRVLDRNVTVDFTTETDADGRFSFAAVPRFDDGMFTAHDRHGATGSTSFPERGEEVVIVIAGQQASNEWLRGTVVDAEGRPAADALVTLGSLHARSKSDGSFALELKHDPIGINTSKAEIRAMKGGFQSAKLACLNERAWHTRAAWPASCALRLGPPTLSIRGRVVYDDGTPVPNPRVMLLDGVEQVPDTIHFPGSTTSTDGDWEVEEETDMDGVVMETSVSSTADSETGTFEVSGLEAGAYRLRVFDPVTYTAMLSEPVTAGRDDVEFVLPNVAAWPALNVVVVGRDGRPIPGADWMFGATTPEGWGKPRIDSQFMHADSEGRIQWQPVGRQVDTLMVKGPGMAEFEMFDYGRFAGVRDGQITVARGVTVRVEMQADPESANQIEFIDVRGRRVPVVLTRGNIARGTRRVPLINGRSESFMAPDDLVELVLLHDWKEVRRIPVTLQSTETNVIRP